jgi:Spy/CpxP family protein refolding chaperone
MRLSSKFNYMTLALGWLIASSLLPGYCLPDSKEDLSKHQAGSAGILPAPVVETTVNPNPPTVDGGHHRHGLPLDLSSLNLTAEQKQTIQQLRGQSADKARVLRQKIKSQRQEMKNLMFDPEASDATIRAKQKELRKLHEQMEEAMLNDFLSVKAVLTPEQKKKLQSLQCK